MKMTVLLLIGLLFPAQAVDRPENAEYLLVRRIAPLLRYKCAACHGANADAIEGGLRLTSLEELQQGGDSHAGRYKQLSQFGGKVIEELFV